MKNEKEKENAVQNQEITEKEKNIKRFKTYEKIFLAIECFIIFGVILIAISAIGTGFFIANNNLEESEYSEQFNNESEMSIVDEYIQERSISEYDLRYSWLKKLEVEDIEKASHAVTFFRVLYVISLIVKVSLAFFILELIRRIFKETSEKETPFTEGNIKKMRMISNILTFWLVWIIPEFNLQSILFIVLLVAIENIFRYGFELQNESDETI